MIPTLIALARRYWPILAVAAVLGLTFLTVRCVDQSMDRAVTSATNTGRAEQRADDLTESANRVEKANAAAETVRRDPAARNAECLRHSRTPENCD